MAPLVKAFTHKNNLFDTKVCVTAQHREMLDQVLDFFEIVPDYDLNLMKTNQNLNNLTADIIIGLRPVLEVFKPDFVFVHGDTTTTMAASLAAFYSGSKVCHVEAGLRTNNKLSPFPEEINRQVTSRIADLHFAPTNNSKQNLLDENINDDTITVTGNTVIDALVQSIDKIKSKPSKKIISLSQDLGNSEVILVTGHRRENHGNGFERICRALKRVSDARPDLKIVYPVHLNPNVKGPVEENLGHLDNVYLIDPLPYQDFVWLMNRSKIILTDSGGVQEEAPSLGKPVLVMRNTTERPEAVDAGTVILVGTDEDIIVNEIFSLLDDEVRFKTMSQLHNPYGDGRSCERILNVIEKYSI